MRPSRTLVEAFLLTYPNRSNSHVLQRHLTVSTTFRVASKSVVPPLEKFIKSHISTVKELSFLISFVLSLAVEVQIE